MVEKKITLEELFEDIGTLTNDAKQKHIDICFEINVLALMYNFKFDLYITNELFEKIDITSVNINFATNHIANYINYIKEKYEI